MSTLATKASELQRQIAEVEHQLLLEHAKKRELEQRLEEERRSLLPPEQALAMEKRNEEIRNLKREKQAIQEWLARGVAEAQRVSLEALALSQALETSTRAEAALHEEMDYLRESALTLEKEKEESLAAARRAEEDIAACEDDHQMLRAKSIPKLNRRDTFGDRQPLLEGRLAHLRRRVAVVETVETAMDCLSASVRRAHHELEKTGAQLQNGVLFDAVRRASDGTGELDDVFETDSYDSADEAAPTKYAPAVLEAAKGTISKCDGSLASVWAALGRFQMDWKRSDHHQQARHEEVLQSLLQDRSDTLQRCKEHLAELAAELSMRLARRDAIEVIRDSALDRARQRQGRTAVGPMGSGSFSRTQGSSEGDGGPRSPRGAGGDLVHDTEEQQARFSLLAFVQEEHREHVASRATMMEEHNRLVAKHASRVADYDAVRGMKRLYRDLELKQYELKAEMEKLDTENRRMKLQLWEMGATGPAAKKLVRRGVTSPSPRKRGPRMLLPAR